MSIDCINKWNCVHPNNRWKWQKKNTNKKRFPLLFCVLYLSVRFIAFSFKLFRDNSDVILSRWSITFCVGSNVECYNVYMVCCWCCWCCCWCCRCCLVLIDKIDSEYFFSASHMNLYSTVIRYCWYIEAFWICPFFMQLETDEAWGNWYWFGDCLSLRSIHFFSHKYDGCFERLHFQSELWIFEHSPKSSFCYHHCDTDWVCCRDFYFYWGKVFCNLMMIIVIIISLLTIQCHFNSRKFRSIFTALTNIFFLFERFVFHFWCIKEEKTAIWSVHWKVL